MRWDIRLKTDESEGLIQPQGSGIPIAILPEQRYLEEIIKKVKSLVMSNNGCIFAP